MTESLKEKRDSIAKDVARVIGCTMEDAYLYVAFVGGLGGIVKRSEHTLKAIKMVSVALTLPYDEELTEVLVQIFDASVEFEAEKAGQLVN